MRFHRLNSISTAIRASGLLLNPFRQYAMSTVSVARQAQAMGTNIPTTMPLVPITVTITPSQVEALSSLVKAIVLSETQTRKRTSSLKAPVQLKVVPEPSLSQSTKKSTSTSVLNKVKDTSSSTKASAANVDGTAKLSSVKPCVDSSASVKSSASAKVYSSSTAAPAASKTGATSTASTAATKTGTTACSTTAKPAATPAVPQPISESTLAIKKSEKKKSTKSKVCSKSAAVTAITAKAVAAAVNPVCAKIEPDSNPKTNDTVRSTAPVVNSNCSATLTTKKGSKRETLLCKTSASSNKAVSTKRVVSAVKSGNSVSKKTSKSEQVFTLSSDQSYPSDPDVPVSPRNLSAPSSKTCAKTLDKGPECQSGSPEAVETPNRVNSKTSSRRTKQPPIFHGRMVFF